MGMRGQFCAPLIMQQGINAPSALVTTTALPLAMAPAFIKGPAKDKAEQAVAVAGARTRAKTKAEEEVRTVDMDSSGRTTHGGKFVAISLTTQRPCSWWARPGNGRKR